MVKGDCALLTTLSGREGIDAGTGCTQFVAHPVKLSIATLALSQKKCFRLFMLLPCSRRQRHHDELRFLRSGLGRLVLRHLVEPETPVINR